MPSEILKLTTEIVVSHTSMTELTPDNSGRDKSRLQYAGILRGRGNFRGAG
jgi:hypothetical protein